MAVFYRPDIEKSASPEKTDALKGTTQARLDALQRELDWAKDIEQKRRIREEILSIKREFNRTKQYTSIMTTKPAEGKNSLDAISAADLMRIDKESKLRRGEFLSKSFLYKRTADKEGNISEEPSDGKDLKEWDTLFVDFGKNRSANNRIGLWHMLSTDIGYVKVGGRIWVRTIINGRVGYYTKPSPDGYIPVFTGDVVAFPTASDISAFEKQKDANLQRNSNQEENDKANDIYIERLERAPESSNVEVSVLMRESYDFLKEKWLTEAQIAWVIASEYQESRCNPRANNSNVSFGIFQWKADRIEKIQKATGINIHEASHTEQLRALWWEMTEDPYEKKVYPLLKQANTPSEAASIFVNEFERPADKIWEPILRWKIAENIFYKFKFINNPELMNLAEWPANQAILDKALQAQSKWDIMWAEHCTDWVDKVYQQSIGKSVYETHLYFNGITKISNWTWLWAGEYANESIISSIKPWMHIIVDKPQNWEYNQWKTHSILALTPPIDGVLKVVSYPNGGNPPKIEIYDLYGKGRAKDGKAIRIQWV